jgi:integrase
LKIRLVDAVQTWLEASGITDGLLFRAVHLGGYARSWGMRRADVAEVVKRHAEAAGLDPSTSSGHSLRAGFVTSAAETGATIFKIAEVSRHKSTDVLDRLRALGQSVPRSCRVGVPMIVGKSSFLRHSVTVTKFNP